MTHHYWADCLVYRRKEICDSVKSYNPIQRLARNFQTAIVRESPAIQRARISTTNLHKYRNARLSFIGIGGRLAKSKQPPIPVDDRRLPCEQDAGPRRLNEPSVGETGRVATNSLRLKVTGV